MAIVPLQLAHPGNVTVCMLAGTSSSNTIFISSLSVPSFGNGIAAACRNSLSCIVLSYSSLLTWSSALPFTELVLELSSKKVLAWPFEHRFVVQLADVCFNPFVMCSSSCGGFGIGSIMCAMSPVRPRIAANASDINRSSRINILIASSFLELFFRNCFFTVFLPFGLCVWICNVQLRPVVSLGRAIQILGNVACCCCFQSRCVPHLRFSNE